MLKHSFPIAAIGLCFAILPATLRAELPAPPTDLANWSTPWDPAASGLIAADSFLPKPAGKLGPVVARGGHFFTGNQRIRFWGVNIAFSAAFPTHDQADAIAQRFARFGINAVRFHHMDNQPFPNGIFTDRSLEKLSPEALDRLDYFIAALKREGVYANLNLHVSRSWSHAHNWPNANQFPEFDKMVDLFHPDLIAAQKQYARDLLTHVNPYTKTRYADEPAVAMVEITNEDSMFFWGGEQKLAEFPEPYAALFTKLWNQWLLKKYPSRAQLVTAWNAGVQPLGLNQVRDPLFLTLTKPNTSWNLEQHENAKASVSLDTSDPNIPLAKLSIAAISSAPWHLQFSQPGFTLKKGQTYTVSFRTKADIPTKLDVVVSQAHDPWSNLGFSHTANITSTSADHQLSFIATADDSNARISFSVGREITNIYLGNLKLRPGSPAPISGDEDPAKGTVSRPHAGGAVSAQRTADWFDFVQSTDESYFVEMRRFLKEDLAVKAPVTGSIGLGPLGTLSQSKMDFVDAHAYWDHPDFPGGGWSATNWTLKNKPMVDNPAGATLWGLAATRVAGKPFTVTEYNHPAPGDWQAECIPMIAAYAALQDWDGVFIFSYSHSDRIAKTHTTSFFDIEGNPLKLPLMPFAARLFLTQSLKPLASESLVTPQRPDMLRTGSRYYYEIFPFLRDIHNLKWQDALNSRLAVAFNHPPTVTPRSSTDPRISWTSNGPDTATGRFIVRDPSAAIFVGFANGATLIDLGSVRIDKLDTPFAALMLIPADPSQTLATADRLLLTAVARGDNTNMQWDARRRTISNRWGTAPSRIEVVKATLTIPSARSLKVFALSPTGQRDHELPVKSLPNSQVQLDLGSSPTIWYELVRQ